MIWFTVQLLPDVRDLFGEELQKSFRKLKNRVVRWKLEGWLLQKKSLHNLLQRHHGGVFVNLNVEISHLCSVNRVAQLLY
jgi:hypothetical protein